MKWEDIRIEFNDFFSLGIFEWTPDLYAKHTDI